MSPSEGALYRPLVWSIAAALLGAGALLSIQMISAVVGPFRLAQLGEHDPRGAVALFRDAHQPLGAAVRSPFGHALVETGRSVRELTSLQDLDPARVGVVVLSELRVLTDDEAARLRDFLAAGGGAVLVGSFGVRDADGAWRGYETMRKLLGAEVLPLDRDRAQVDRGEPSRADRGGAAPAPADRRDARKRVFLVRASPTPSCVGQERRPTGMRRRRRCGATSATAASPGSPSVPSAWSATP